MEQKRNLGWGESINLRMVVIGVNLPKDLPPYSTASGTINIGEHKE